MFLFGPLMYFYTKAITRLPVKSKKVRMHLVPFLVALFVFAPLLVSGITETIDKLADSNQQATRRIYFIILGIQVVHILTYNVLSLKRLSEYKKELLNRFSFLDRKEKMSWLKQLIIGYSLILCYSVFYYGIMVSGAIYMFNLNIDFFITLIVSICINVIAIKSFLAPQITLLENQEEASQTRDNEKYKSSSLSEEDLEEHQVKLLQLMENDKPHLNSSLRLVELAEYIKLTPHQLSQVINQQLEKSFFDFINGYRVQEAKKMLKEKREEKILTIAYEAGFNSKAAFNRAFKKHTSTSPSQFKKAL